MDSNQILGGLEIGGAIAGTVASGGALAPELIPIGIGGASTIAGDKGQKAAKQMMPPYQDPALTQFGNEIDRQRKSFESGSAYSQEMRELKNQQSANQVGVLRSQGGNTGASLAALRAVGMDTGNAYGKIAAKGQDREDAYTGMLNDILNNRADRTLDIQNAQYNQAMLDARNKSAFGAQTGLSMLSALGKPNANNKSLWDSLFGGSKGTSSVPSPISPPTAQQAIDGASILDSVGGAASQVGGLSTQLLSLASGV